MPPAHPVRYTNGGEMNSSTDGYRSKKNQINAKNGNHTMVAFLTAQYCSKPRKANRCSLPFLSSFWLLFYHLGGNFFCLWPFDFMCILQISRCAQYFNLHNGFILQVHTISQSGFLFLQTSKKIESLTNPIHLEETRDIFSQSSLCRYVGLLFFQWIISPLRCSTE